MFEISTGPVLSAWNKITAWPTEVWISFYEMVCCGFVHRLVTVCSDVSAERTAQSSGWLSGAYWCCSKLICLLYTKVDCHFDCSEIFISSLYNGLISFFHPTVTLKVEALRQNVQNWKHKLALFIFRVINFIFFNIYPTRCNVTQFILSGNWSTCFGWYFHPSSGAHTTVSTASLICHAVTAICRYRERVGTGLSVLWVA
jgi:hypothetical protein